MIITTLRELRSAQFANVTFLCTLILIDFNTVTYTMYVHVEYTHVMFTKQCIYIYNFSHSVLIHAWILKGASWWTLRYKNFN